MAGLIALTKTASNGSLILPAYRGRALRHIKSELHLIKNFDAITTTFGVGRSPDIAHQQLHQIRLDGQG